MSELAAPPATTVTELTPEDDAFPRRLLRLREPPRRLYALGDLSLLGRPLVSIIGSRRPTPYGIRVAYGAARAVAEVGGVVVSGLARGLDARAHQGALDAGGATIAVLGTGPDVVYPSRNRDLYDDVRERGLLLSEYAPGTPPRAYHFPARNRVIAALSPVLLVVEGSVKGGTQNTVGWAHDIGVTIFAVPGRIEDEVASGPNHLIQQGAAVYLGPDDLLQALGLKVPGSVSAAGGAAGRGASSLANAVTDAAWGNVLSAAEATLYDMVTPGPQHVDALAARAALDPALVLAALSGLELRGLVMRLPGQHFALAS